MNYFDLWISNLGVVPLFSFAFFLLRPIFFCLFSLLILVCCVLEAIIKPLKLLKYKHVLLPILIFNVKVFVISSLLVISRVYATETQVSHFIGIGEQTEITTKGLLRFSVGNKQVLSTKLQKSKEKLLVKGLMKGFSDIVIWSNDDQKSVHRFFVKTKREDLRSSQIEQELKSIGLSLTESNFTLTINGYLKTSEQYLKYHALRKVKKKLWIENLQLSKELQKEIIKTVYQKLNPISNYIECHSLKAQVKCLYEGRIEKSSQYTYLKNDLFISFVKDHDSQTSGNYKVEYKILHISTQENQTQKLGTEFIRKPIEQILNNNPENFFDGNVFHLENTNLSVHTVASPTQILLPQNESVLKLGSQIRQVVRQEQVNTLTWKFSGLKIKHLIEETYPFVKLDVSTELSSPTNDGNIYGSHSKSSFYIKLDQYIEILNIDLSNKANQQASLTFIEAIPILKKLFTSNNKLYEKSHIKIFLKVTQHEF